MGGITALSRARAHRVGPRDGRARLVSAGRWRVEGTAHRDDRHHVDQREPQREHPRPTIAGCAGRQCQARVEATAQPATKRVPSSAS